MTVQHLCRDGNLGDIAKAGSLHEFLLDLHKQFGPIASFWWGPTYVVSIANAEMFKQHHNVFDRPRKYCTKLVELFFVSRKYCTKLVDFFCKSHINLPLFSRLFEPVMTCLT